MTSEKSFLSTEEKDDKVIEFSKGKKYYGKLIDQKMDDGDLVGALSFAFAALKNDYTIENLADVADIYADMSLYELSNEYWFRYLAIAPENKKGVAYEELAINAFECKNYGLSAYYLHQKISVDGSSENGNLGDEIFRAMSGAINKKDLYKIVYPERLSDYSAEIAFSKAAATAGEYRGVIEALKDVPEESPSFREAAEELATAYFAEERVEEAVTLTRRLIAEYGGTLNLYCSLSSMYSYLKDYEKADYFYQKAKEYPVEGDDGIKFAVCACERGDFSVAASAFKKCLPVDFYDDRVLCCYAVALINSGDFTAAEKLFKKVYSINPKDPNLKYLTELAVRAAEGKGVDVLPLPFDGDLPEAELAAREKFLSAVSEKGSVKAKDKDRFYEYFAWGVVDGGEPFRKCLMIATSFCDEKMTECFKNALFSEEVNSARKQAIIFVLITTGYKKQIAYASQGVFFSFRPRKLLSEKEGNEAFFSSYAMAISKMAFSGENLDKIAFCSNALYKKLKDEEVIKLVSHEELAAATVAECKFDSVKNVKDLYPVFGVKEERMQKLLAFIREKNGKNH